MTSPPLSRPRPRLRITTTLLLALALPTRAADLEQLVAEHFHVRVLLGQAQSERVVTPTGPCVLLNQNEEITAVVEGGEQIVVDCSGMAPAPPVWRVLLAEFEREKPRARALAARVGEALNFPAEVIEIDGAEGEGAERMLVTLGVFDSEEEAAAHLRGAQALVPQARLWHDDRRRDVARLRLRSADDRVIGEFWEQCALVPVDDPTLIALGSGRSRRSHRGSMVFRVDRERRILAINNVFVEDYLMSVVASEIGGEAPPAAMRAQAIVARSEALHKVDSVHHASAHWDLCDTTHCQAYNGVEAETEASRQAVRDTRGMVLMVGGQVCDAVYSHSCGGVTANMEDVWRSDGAPWSVARLDTALAPRAPDLSREGALREFLDDPPAVMCNPEGRAHFPNYARDNFRWSARYSARGLSLALGEDLGEIQSVRVTQRARSGRVVRLLVTGTDGEVDLYKSTAIREALPELRSTLFVVEEERDADGTLRHARFVGGGWGHGVGMCQMGAYARALQGQSHQQILDAYFTGAELRRVY